MVAPQTSQSDLRGLRPTDLQSASVPRGAARSAGPNLWV